MQRKSPCVARRYTGAFTIELSGVRRPYAHYEACDRKRRNNDRLSRHERHFGRRVQPVPLASSAGKPFKRMGGNRGCHAPRLSQRLWVFCIELPGIDEEPDTP